MLAALSSRSRAAGVRQVRKAVRQGRAKEVLLARDADPAITEPLAAECAAAGIPVSGEHTMAQLGKACGLAVGAAAVALL